MTLSDIPTVVAIEQASYHDHWIARDYFHELTENKWAHYFVLKQSEAIIGVSGLLLLADEAHVMTIAVSPTWQGLGLGEGLLGHLLTIAPSFGATVATLEVRRSNHSAIALYQKYGFVEVGCRKGYYDNGEDALILTTPHFESDLTDATFSKPCMRGCLTGLTS